MKTIHLMLKPASALCNLRCRYCFYADVSSHREIHSHGIMTADTAEAILRNLSAELKPGDRVHFAFQGGEPTLAGLPFFRDFVNRVSQWKEIGVSWALQTNGILLDNAWCTFLKEHRFLVGLSLDLLPEAHDRTRVDPAGKGSYRQVTDRLSLLKRHGVAVNVLCTLTAAVARHPQQVWNQLGKLGVDYVQFTPCLRALDGGSSPYALTPRLFASFYTQLFRLWYADFQQGIRRSVKLFDDVVNQLLLGRPTGCGMNGVCQPQLVIEADGSAYPCDFFCLDQYKLGNLTTQTLSQLLQAPALMAFLQRPHEKPQPCTACRYHVFCGGNCKRMQREICCIEEDGFCGYRSFLEQWGETLLQLAEQIRQLHSKYGGN